MSLFQRRVTTWFTWPCVCVRLCSGDVFTRSLHRATIDHLSLSSNTSWLAADWERRCTRDCSAMHVYLCVNLSIFFTLSLNRWVCFVFASNDKEENDKRVREDDGKRNHSLWFDAVEGTFVAWFFCCSQCCYHWGNLWFKRERCHQCFRFNVKISSV